MTYIRFSLLALVVILLAGCPELGTQERTVTAELPANPTWSADVKPILDTHCNECHSVPATQLAPPTLRLDVCETVDGLPGAQSQAIRIVFRTIDQIPSPMPPATYSTYPSADEQEILQRWADQGAPCDGDTPANINPNNTMSDMGTNMNMDTGMTGMDTAGAVDMGVDTGPDIGPDLPPAAATWAMVAQQLVQKCAGCHDGGRQNLTIPMNATPAELRPFIENMNALTGDMNPFITPNDPMASEIFLRVNSADMAFRMPRNAAQVDQQLADLLTSWINDGAPYN